MAENQETKGRLLTVRDAAAYLCCSERTVWEMLRRKELPAVRFGKQLTRIDAADLDAFIQRSKGAA